jgi:hypothetical protein
LMDICDKVSREIADFHPNILATGVAKDAEFLAYYFKERVWIPKPERITVMLGQAMVLTGLPELNENFFGKTRVVTVQHDNVKILLFPNDGESQTTDMQGLHRLVQADPCIVVVVATPPFPHDELVSRVLDYLRTVSICLL